MKLQTKLLLVLLPLTVLPLVGVGWLAYTQLRNTSEQQALQQMSAVLGQLTLNLETKLQAAQGTVKLFADAVLVRKYVLTADEEERYSLLLSPLLKLFGTYLKTYSEYDEIRILLPDGYEDARATRGQIANLTEQEDTGPFFKGLAGHDGTVFSTLLKNPDTQQFALFLGMALRLADPTLDPVLAKPRLRGYLAVTMSLDYLKALVKNERIGKTGVLFFSLGGGQVLYHPDETLGDTLLPNALTQKLRHHALTGTPFRAVFQGQAAVFSAQQVHAGLNEDTYIVGMLPEAELLSGSHSLGAMVAAITLGTVLVTAALLLGLLKFLVVNPIRRLRVAAQEIGKGNLAPTVDVKTVDELGELAGTFKEMGKSLQSSARKIEHLAYHDSLTGLPNRLLFQEFLSHMLANTKRHRLTIALLYLDIDDFKHINDNLGHDIGDLFLKEVARRLSGTLRHEDLIARKTWDESQNLVARLGGDEFVIILADIAQEQHASIVAERVIEALSKPPYTIAGHELYASASIGITLYPVDGMEANALIKCADVAMYHAKKQGKNTCRFYSPRLNEAAHERLILENRLRRAILRGELMLYYQPQIEPGSLRIVGFEALLRWQDPELGIVLTDPLHSRGGRYRLDTSSRRVGAGTSLSSEQGVAGRWPKQGNNGR